MVEVGSFTETTEASLNPALSSVNENVLVCRIESTDKAGVAAA